MKQFLATIIFASLCINNISAQSGKNFLSGEKVVFDAWYNWGFIWLHAGEAMFKTSDTVFNHEPAYKLHATGITFKGYDKFFKVRDTFTSIVTTHEMNPLFFERNTNEGSYSAEIRYSFDYEANMVHGEKVKPGKATKKASYILPENTKDMLSVIYYLREIDFSGLKEDDKIFINMVVDNEMWELYVRYQGKKVVKLKSGRKFRCLVLSPLLLEGSVFSGGEGMKIYVTDDRNRLPVYIESKVLIGKVKASMKEVHNMKYAFTSEVY